MEAYWTRYDDVIFLRQQLRYLSLSSLLDRSERAATLDLTTYELSVFSQNGEDGVLHEILRRVPPEKRSFVEIGAGVNESNCLLLASGFGWSGVWVEGQHEASSELAERFRHLPRVVVLRPPNYRRV